MSILFALLITIVADAADTSSKNAFTSTAPTTTKGAATDRTQTKAASEPTPEPTPEPTRGAYAPPPPESSTPISAPASQQGQSGNGNASTAKRIDAVEYTGAMPDPKSPLPVIKSEITQSNSYLESRKLDVSCVDQNQNGRKDPACAANPKHPTCTGLRKAVTNSTNCEMMSPDGICLSYGADGFSGSDWIAFASEYQAAIGGCFDRAARATNSNMSMYNNDNAGNGTTTVYETVKGLSTESGISGSGGDSGRSGASSGGVAEKSEEEMNAEALAATEIDDGSEALGYERGHITERTKKKDPFAEIFADSPFASKINAKLKEKYTTAIENSATLTKEIAEKSPLKEASEDEEMVAEEKKESAPAPAALRDPKSMGPGYVAFKSPAPADGTEKSREHSTLLNRAPASTATAPQQAALIAADENVSIFQRVKSQYRRRAPGMNILLPSETASKIHGMETPDFFKSL